MTENEAKAIKWMKNVRDDAVVTLDHIQKNEPNVSPMLYEGRKQKAETIIAGFEELAKYRAIGTAEEFKALKDKSEPKKPIKHGLRENKVMCPHCTNWLEAHSSKVFCCYCGSMIDWN